MFLKRRYQKRVRGAWVWIWDLSGKRAHGHQYSLHQYSKHFLPHFAHRTNSKTTSDSSDAITANQMIPDVKYTAVLNIILDKCTNKGMNSMQTHIKNPSDRVKMKPDF